MRKLLVPIALTAALSGGAGAIVFGPAFAGARTDTETPDTETPAEDEVVRANPIEDALAGLVEDGTLTQAQADKVIEAIEAARPLKAFGPRLHEKIGVALDEAAEVLGITEDELRTQLRDGKSLAEIAGDKKDELIAQLVAGANERLDEAVANDKLTQERADELKANTEERVTGMVENGPRLRFRGEGRPGLHFGGGEVDELEDGEGDA